MADEPHLPPPPPPDPRQEPTTGRSVFRVLGTVLATVLVLGGLVMVGLVVFFVIAINNYGSNK